MTKMELAVRLEIMVRRRFPHTVDREKLMEYEEYCQFMDSQTCKDCREFQYGICRGQDYLGMTQIIDGCLLPPLQTSDN